MENANPIEINLKEYMSSQPQEYRAVVKLILQAILEKSEKKRNEARKTLVATLQEDGVRLEQVLSIDDQIVMTAYVEGKKISAYLCDKPKIYQGEPSVAKRFVVK